MKEIIFVLRKSQQSKLLTAGGMLKLNLDTFVVVRYRTDRFVVVSNNIDFLRIQISIQIQIIKKIYGLAMMLNNFLG